MAIAASMNGDEENDGHENDLIMPGFRFHPTEEELINFYLRRKVEGKHFNVELITFLDLYSYDPWELPALAAIGEKEWYFYAPRDRKYRNGDRPNRVTTSGYWKATGADRMIRSENLRSIGLKKTLVFYVGKAPRGLRTCWIMNEYRLPHNEAQKYQKTEISVCRVYKRGGSEDHLRPPSSSKSKKHSDKCQTQNNTATNTATLQISESAPHTDKVHEAAQNCSITNNTTIPCMTVSSAQFTIKSLLEGANLSIDQSELLMPIMNALPSTSLASVKADDLSNQEGFIEQGNCLVSANQLQIPISSVTGNQLAFISEKAWEWNSIEVAKEMHTPLRYMN